MAARHSTLWNIRFVVLLLVAVWIGAIAAALYSRPRPEAGGGGARQENDFWHTGGSPEAVAWELTIPNADSLNATLGPGEALFVPVVADFTAVLVDSQSRRRFKHGTIALDEAWVEQGGTWKVEDNILTAHSPGRPGVFRLTLTAPGGRTFESVVVLALRTKLSRYVLGIQDPGYPGGWVRVGKYSNPRAKSAPEMVREHSAAYVIPRWFVPVTRDNEKVPISRTLLLGQMVGFLKRRKPSDPYVRHFSYFSPSVSLTRKIDRLAERLREKGYDFKGFYVTSGFRTPSFNRSIRGAEFSRHCYGNALDIIVDTDGDERMDDLNGDGRIGREDGLIIAETCRELESAGEIIPGGIGVYEYPSPKSVGSHVHIDARGYPVRWGCTWKSGRKRAFTWAPENEVEMDDD